MSEREQFEAWVSGSGRAHMLEREKPHGWYKDLTVTAWWTAWQASRRAALEEAAKHVETLGLVFFFGEQEFAKTGRACTADAIRTLATETNNG